MAVGTVTGCAPFPDATPQPIWVSVTVPASATDASRCGSGHSPDHTRSLAGYGILAHESGEVVAPGTLIRPLAPRLAEDLFEHLGIGEAWEVFPWWIMVTPGIFGTEVQDALPRQEAWSWNCRLEHATTYVEGFRHLRVPMNARARMGTAAAGERAGMACQNGALWLNGYTES